MIREGELETEGAEGSTENGNDEGELIAVRGDSTGGQVIHIQVAGEDLITDGN